MSNACPACGVSLGATRDGDESRPMHRGDLGHCGFCNELVVVTPEGLKLARPVESRVSSSPFKLAKLEAVEGPTRPRGKS